MAEGLHIVCASRAAVIALFVGLCMSLQGCTFFVPQHTIGNWRRHARYLNTFGYTPKDNASAVVVNTCMYDKLPSTLRCNGHGTCEQWLDGATTQSLSFCRCNLYWADPECTTERKSQAVAFVLSLFFGLFGVDQWYLGYWMPFGIFKLVTAGGGGVWYMWDLLRLAQEPALTSSKYRLAADLPHWLGMVVLLSFLVFMGMALSWVSTAVQHRIRHLEIMRHLHERKREDQAEEIKGPATWLRSPEPRAFSGKGFHLQGESLPTYGGASTPGASYVPSEGSGSAASMLIDSMPPLPGSFTNPFKSAAAARSYRSLKGSTRSVASSNPSTQHPVPGSQTMHSLPPPPVTERNPFQSVWDSQSSLRVSSSANPFVSQCGGAGGTRSFGEHTPSPFESTAVQAEHVNPFVSAYGGVGQSQKDPFQSQTSPPSPFESTLPQSSPFASFAQARSPFESRSVALG